MTKQQFSQALKIAKSDQDLSNVDNSVIFGYGLPDFKPVHVTLEMVAKEIRWNSFLFDGTICSTALNEVATLGRRNFLII
jgi:hypothetical protein